MNADQTQRIVARIHEIKVSLERIDENEKTEKEELDSGRDDFKLQELAVENMFLRARVELYNEKSKLESSLVHGRAEEPKGLNKDELIRIAKQANLAKALNTQGHPEEVKASSCWTNCVECVTSCTECVTSCTECVSSPGGSCTISSLVSSPCVPKPDVFD